MADEAAGYIHLFDLAVDWANAGNLPKEMVLRRLCEWAVVGAFPPAALVDRFGTEIVPLEMFKDFRAALVDRGSVTMGGWGMHIDPADALHRLKEVRVAVNELQAFCDRTNTVLPPLLFSGFRRRWAAKGGKNVAPPVCPGADEEADRQEFRRNAAISMNTLRSQLNGLQGKPTAVYSHRRRREQGERVNFNYVGPEWAQMRAYALSATERAGDNTGSLRQQLDELDAEWAAFVEAEASSPHDLTWQTRVAENRSDWNEIRDAASSITAERFEAKFFSVAKPALPAPIVPAAEFSENLENSSVALAEAPPEGKRRRGRPKGSGSYEAVDEPLIDEMREAIEANPALSPTAAAERLADRAPGGGTKDSKTRRLVQRYLEKFGG